MSVSWGDQIGQRSGGTCALTSSMISTTMSNPLPPTTTAALTMPGSSGTSSDMMPPPPPPAASAQAPVAGPQENTATPTPVSEFTTLRTHIQTLTELNNRLQAVRHIPAQLLRPSNLDKELLKMNLETTRHGFKELVTIAETVRSDKVQDALKAARKSELADPSNLGSNLRRENLKRRYGRTI